MKANRHLVVSLLVFYVITALLKNLLNLTLIIDLWVLIVHLVMGGVTLIHAFQWIGKKNTLVFFLITFVVAWSLESLSIATTFPFGHYYYTDQLLLKLGQVPVIIMFAYFAVGYLSWVMAHVFAGCYGKPYGRGDVFLVPGLAAIIMVAWDMTFDPLSSTIVGLWVWVDGGSYFGVPIQNFAGWYLCVYIIYTLYFLFIRSKQLPVTPRQLESRWFWAYPALAYLIFSVDTITKPFRALLGYDPNAPVPAVNEEVELWMTYDIYYALALVSVFTMTLLGALALVQVYKNADLK
ncbi:carotenoid biosynthesis protein [Marinoscillum furvescens]|uniref:Putative membrane protein n=1 Tax=Marinoscillum furvescens DSM 4134 TaxID=1122208 RepID=A0A3D9L065_MARFU|nr:carotenoid biosynthesis protein [Marinoscillum furvescens]RED94079.1 putative membrane protein [Marinoscillum furvescens DSM 4134]